MAKRTNPRNHGRNNGHRKGQLRARVLAEETHCILCGRRVDTTLGPGLPTSPEVDHITPIARGGAPYSRDNVALIHRACNGWKGKRTLDEALAALAGGTKATQPRTAPVAHSNTW